MIEETTQFLGSERSREELINFIRRLPISGSTRIDIYQQELNKPVPTSRRQENALHLSFRQFAQDLNESGYSIKRAIELGLLKMDVEWDEGHIKQVYREIMKAMYPDKEWKNPDKPSTKELSGKEKAECWEVLNRGMGEKFGVTLPFPSDAL